MNKKLLILPIAVIGLAVFLINNQPQQTVLSKNLSSNISNSPTTTLTPQTETFGAVTVEISPIQIGFENPNIFKLSLNTHSIDLSYNYTQIATFIKIH